MKRYVADFENTVPKPIWFYEGDVPDEYYEIEYEEFDSDGNPTAATAYIPCEDARKETRVWAAGISAIDNRDPANVKVSTDIDGFFQNLFAMISKGRDQIHEVYFHNLAYDGPLIMDRLLRAGYQEANNPFKMPEGCFCAMVSGENKWYQITVHFRGTSKIVKFKDSLKILPFSVAALQKNFKTSTGKIQEPKGFYQEYRAPGHALTDEETRYLCHDILTVAEALSGVEQYGLLGSLTIGSAALKDFKDRVGKDKYEALFPELPEDAFVRKSYKGAWCFNNTDGAIIDTKAHTVVFISGNRVRVGQRGYTYDVNSLYPSVLKGHVYPIGLGHWFSADEFDQHKADAYCVRFIATFELKKHMPWVQLTNARTGRNDYIRNGESVEITMVRPDFELFQEFYDIKEIEILGGYWYAQAGNVFDDYIDHWFAIKASEKHGNQCLYQIAKLFLNNLYGKLATSVHATSASLFLDPKTDRLSRNVYVEQRRGGHIAAGSYVTAYARGVTIRAAEQNWENFCYADTDSLHLIGPANGITVGNKIGEWNNEAKWDKARFVRQKTYIEHIVEDDNGACDPYWNVKACGASSEVKNRILHNCTIKQPNGRYEYFDPCPSNACTDEELLEKFTFGLYEIGKLVHKTVKGGSILQETSFRISKQKDWEDIAPMLDNFLKD